MKYLVMSIIMFIFVSCEEETSNTVIYKKDCNDNVCICRGNTRTPKASVITVFKCDSTLSVGDTISNKLIY